MKTNMKKAMTTILLTGVFILLASKALNASETVNSQITIETKLESLTSKIAQSDVPDNMLALLTALRATNQYVGLANSDVPDNMMSIRLEAKTLLEWMRANPKERNVLENIEYINLNGALDDVLKVVR